MKKHAWTRIELFYQDDLSLAGTESTNDNLDHGEPTEYAEWKVNFKSIIDLRKRYLGNSPWQGIGHQVSLTIDGDHWRPADLWPGDLVTTHEGELIGTVIQCGVDEDDGWFLVRDPDDETDEKWYHMDDLTMKGAE